MRAHLALGFAASGCSAYGMADGAPSEPLANDSGSVRTISLRLNVLPSELRDSSSPDAGFRALPQTFGRDSVTDSAPVSFDTLNLVTPVLQTGVITAFRVNANVADVPGEIVPVEGLVQIAVPGSVQSYLAAVNATGAFQSWVVPGADYALQVIPNDPLLPMQSTTFAVESPARAAVIDLDAGVPIYGFVTVQGVPMVGARIHLTDPLGVGSATTETDTGGYYQIRVEPGTWTLVCEGRDNGRDPTVTLSAQEVGEVGAALNLDYPPLPYAQVEGSVDDADGQPAKGATVRLVSQTLVGFDEATGLHATWSSDVPVQDDGFFYSAVVPGTFTVEVLPPPSEKGDLLTPVALDPVTFRTNYNSLDPIAFQPLVSISGTVRGPSGAGLGSAHVLCREDGFDQRTYEVFTKDAGQYTMDVPRVPLTCEVSAPALNGRLATSRFAVDPTDGRSFEFALNEGEVVDGRVFLDGAAEVYAVVEVRDSAGNVLGSGLTGKDGGFAIPVDLKSAAPDVP